MPMFSFEYKIFRPRMRTIHSLAVFEGKNYREALMAAKESLTAEYRDSSKGLNVIIRINYLKLFFC